MKKVHIIIVMIFLVISLTGCSVKTFEKGFNEDIPSSNNIYYLSGIKSNKRVFNINNVTMDFYFGTRYDGDTGKLKWENMPILQQDEEFVCYAAYFYTNVSVIEVRDIWPIVDAIKISLIFILLKNIHLKKCYQKK